MCLIHTHAMPFSLLVQIIIRNYHLAKTILANTMKSNLKVSLKTMPIGGKI